MRGVVVLCALAGCGRIGFGLHGDASLTADGAGDAAPDGPLTSTIQYAGVFVTRHPGPGAIDTFTASAHAAGDMIVMQLGCGATTNPPGSISMALPAGWMLTPLGQATQGAQLATQRFVLVAPDANPGSFTISWQGSTCDIGTSVLADEFSGVDVASGFTGVAGTGDCQVSFKSAAPAETIWAACFTQSAITGIGPGYTAGAANGGGDAAEYRITTDPVDSLESPTFMNSSGYIIDAIELKSR